MSTDWHSRRLQGPLLALANQFYKRVNKHMKARGDETAWLGSVGNEPLVALRLRPLEPPWQLLTGVLVAPDARGQGLATRLLTDAAADYRAGHTWLFCEPVLCPLYLRAGFTLCANLPAPLRSRLQRYQQKTPALVAMVWKPDDGTTAV